MDKHLGLVMTGGGARAAFQVGVLKALYEIIGKDQNLFDIISGNSAGAINATYLASNCENWNIATQNLVELWSKVKPQNIYDLGPKTISDLGLKWMSGTLLGGLTNKGSSINHLLDTHPLRKLAEKEINFEHIGTNIKHRHLHGISLSVTSYNTGSSVIFYNSEASILDWTRSDRFSYKTDLSVDHLMASSSIPFFFPPVQIGESFYGDGCIRQTTPLSPCIHLGANKIIAIGVRHARNLGDMMTQTFASFPNPSMGHIIGTMLNAIFLDSLDADVERLIRINELISEGAHPELRPIPILLIRPSRDLGKMSGDISKELPGMLRYLLKGIGVTGKEGLDLLSYLAFDPSYSKPLIELGYEDTYRMKDQVLKFIDPV